MTILEQLETIIADNMSPDHTFCFICAQLPKVQPQVLHTDTCPILKIWEIVEVEKMKTRNTRGC